MRPGPTAPRYHALIPAAGSGTRVGERTPKQYLELAGRALIEHTVRRFADDPRIAGVFVVLAAGDVAPQGGGRDAAERGHLRRRRDHPVLLPALQRRRGERELGKVAPPAGASVLDAGEKLPRILVC